MLRIDGDPRKCMRRLLTIHAHPDDETTKGGGSVARYTAVGVGTVLVCCTGEAGTVLNPALKRPEVQARLAEVRRQELAAATMHLGYQRVWMLGYQDSNMPASGAPGTLAAAPLGGDNLGTRPPHPAGAAACRRDLLRQPARLSTSRSSPGARGVGTSLQGCRRPRVSP